LKSQPSKKTGVSDVVRHTFDPVSTIYEDVGDETVHIWGLGSENQGYGEEPVEKYSSFFDGR
jgi:hypothetical protein